MNILVIPDIHLKTWIFDRAQDILTAGKADRAVCLMDLADDWNMEYQVEKYKKVYDRAITFAKDNPDTLWCYGNHDVSYPWGRLESGYSAYAEQTVIAKLNELEQSLKDPKLIAFVHRVDRVLFSHGGLMAAFVEWLDKELMDADIDDVVAAVNNAPQDYLWSSASPLWSRPQYNYSGEPVFRSDRYTQVVGHTPVESICEKDGVISTDVFSTYRDGRQIGESAMVVINTKTGKYKRVQVK
ncbi:MAG: metallophosphoesterase [Lachnospiraceae bacterium]|nr:metallophosphoesterase [Lachnospiraceae bacterium]